LPEATVNLMLWDLQGEAEHQGTRLEYLRGASGYLLVADLTRRATLDTAIDLERRARGVAPDTATLLVVNKMDLLDRREIDEDALEALRQRAWPIVPASAKTGEGVDEAFRRLTEKILDATAHRAEER
jgi:GTPase SAR1 family protein